MKIYKGIIICLSALMPAMFSACSESEPAGDNVGTATDEVTLKIYLGEEKQATRAGETSVISQGSKIDKLIYAIYTRPIGSTGAYTIDDPVYGGQTEVKNFTSTDTYTLTIKISSEREYNIACWAQSSKCNAYDTSDLSAVKVSYENAVNNDELRDAFSGYRSFSGAANGGTIEVVLRRPFAQINVGTTGADYAALVYDPAVLPNGIRINQSEISVTGVADTYNVLTGTATASTDQTATFSWANLPAWITTGMPTANDYTDKDTDPFVKTTGEEFLEVDMNKDNTFEDYLTSYPTVDKDGKYLTETFKYLSMCYVLVPGGNGTGSNVEVTFNLRDNSNSSNVITLTARNLKNVPVEGNYRTNILGGLYYMNDPVDNPSDPDLPLGPDPTSIFGINTFSVILQDNFDHHYVNKWDQTEESETTEEPETDTTD